MCLLEVFSISGKIIEVKLLNYTEDVVQFLVLLEQWLIFIMCMQIREDTKTGVYVDSLSEEYVSNVDDVTRLLSKVYLL